jgi:hypothetical protein
MKTTNKTNNKITRWNDLEIDTETGEVSEAIAEPQTKPKAKAKSKAKQPIRKWDDDSFKELQFKPEVFQRRLRNVMAEDVRSEIGKAAAKMRGEVEVAPELKSDASISFTDHRDMIFKTLIAHTKMPDGLSLGDLKLIMMQYINYRHMLDEGENDAKWIEKQAINVFYSCIQNILSDTARQLELDEAIEWQEELTEYNALDPITKFYPQKQNGSNKWELCKMQDLHEGRMKGIPADSIGMGFFGSSPYPEDTENARTGMFNHNNRKGRG